MPAGAPLHARGTRGQASGGSPSKENHQAHPSAQAQMQSAPLKMHTGSRPHRLNIAHAAWTSHARFCGMYVTHALTHNVTHALIRYVGITHTHLYHVHVTHTYAYYHVYITRTGTARTSHTHSTSPSRTHTCHLTHTRRVCIRHTRVHLPRLPHYAPAVCRKSHRCGHTRPERLLSWVWGPHPLPAGIRPLSRIDMNSERPGRDETACTG